MLPCTILWNTPYQIFEIHAYFYALQSIFTSLQVSLTTKDCQPIVTKSHCSCKIGLLGACGHTAGVLYQFAKYKLQGLKAIPVDIAKTSQPQTWHVPRGTNIHGDAVQDLIVSGHSKTKTPSLDDGCTKNNQVKLVQPS